MPLFVSKYFSSGANFIKKFVRNLRVFLQSQSVCQTRLEKLTRDKYSRLLRKIVKCGLKSFKTLAPDCLLSAALCKLISSICKSVLFHYNCKKLYFTGPGGACTIKHYGFVSAQIPQLARVLMLLSVSSTSYRQTHQLIM